MRSLVVSHSPRDPVATALTNVLRPLMGHREPVSASFENAEHVYSQTEAELVVVVLPQSAEKGLEAIRRLRTNIQGHLLVVGKATEPKLILRALQHGADHFLDEAELETELDAALTRLFNKREAAAPSGRLLAVLSVSGGCGASTVAVNLSATLAKEHQRCCLVDLNTGRGDLAALLDLKPQFTLADLCLNQARLDRAIFEKMITPHATGIGVLCAPPLFEDVRAIDSHGVGQALALARKYYPHVVVDLEDCFHDEQVVALRQATEVLLICRLNFTALRNARRTLDHIAKQNIPRHRVLLVINQHGQPHELPVDEAEDALGEKFAFFVPYEPKIISASNNTGIPAVLKEPHSKIAQSLIQLACKNYGKPPAPTVSLAKLVLR